MYLPLQFKYNDIYIHDFDKFNELLQQYKPSETFYQAIQWKNGNWVMRYPCGAAVLYSPFYFLSDSICGFTNYAQDGFSKPYQWGILLGCAFYTCLGLFFIKKILSLYFNQIITSITLVVLVVGTNYFFNVACHGGNAMTHNLLFTLYAILIYNSILWHKQFQIKRLIVVAICMGLCFILRATEILCVLFPLLYGVYNKETFFNKVKIIRVYANQFFIGVIIILAIAFIQFSYWKYVSGSFFINPYGASNPGEGLELFKPHIIESLFSFRKGLFIYSPLLILAFVGFFYLYRAKKSLFASTFIYFVISFYVITCWSCWWYGACYGNRALIPTYVALSLPLGFCIERILKNRFKVLFLGVMYLLVGFNCFKMWQAHVYILDLCDVTRDYYFSTLFQNKSTTESQRLLLHKGKSNSGTEIFTKNDSLTHTLAFAKFENFESTRTINLSRTDSCFNFEIPINQITNKRYTWIQAGASISIEDTINLSGEFNIQMKHKGYIFKLKRRSFKGLSLVPKTNNKLQFYYLVPEDLRSKKDLVSVSIVNRGKESIKINNVFIKSYEPIIDKSFY